MDAIVGCNAKYATDLGLHIGIDTGRVIGGSIAHREEQV